MINGKVKAFKRLLTKAEIKLDDLKASEPWNIKEINKLERKIKTYERLLIKAIIESEANDEDISCM